MPNYRVLLAEILGQGRHGMQIDEERDFNMKTKLFGMVAALVLWMPGFALSAAVEGEYKGVSGKVGIYSMSAMRIEKNTDNDKYTVQFSGGRTLTYQTAELAGNKLQINDKGFKIVVAITGDKATVDSAAGQAVFQRIKK